MAAENLPVLIAQAEERVRQVPALAEKHGTKVKVVAAAAAAVVAAPFVMMGIGGLVGGTVIVAGAYTVMQLAPVFARRMQNAKQELLMKEANRYLQSLKAESRKNPVETLENVYREKEASLGAYSGKIHKFATKVNEYGLKVVKMKKDFPDDAPMFDQIHADMTELLNRRRAKFEEAKANLAKLAKEITRASAIWEMTQATAELRESAGDLEENFLQRVRKETAFDAVQSSLASSMADLDQMMMEEVNLDPNARRQQAITNNPSPTLDVNSRVVDVQPVNRS